jgi:CysZ protein
LLALVLYVVFTPLAPILFWVVNGVLLGREYAQLVALRRSDAAGAAAFRKRHRPTIFAAGVLMAVPLTIPVVNLLVPILGAATFTHLYHRLTRTPMSPSRTA